MSADFCLEALGFGAILGKKGPLVYDHSGTPGVPGWGDLVLYLDAGDRASLPPDSANPPDRIYDLSHNVGLDPLVMTSAPSIVNSHLSFNQNNIRYDGTRPANMVNIFAGGGTVAFWVRIRSTATVGRFIDTRGNANNQGYFFGPRGGNPTGYQLEFVRQYTIQNGLWRLDVDAFGAAVPFDQWVHIALTFTDAPGNGSPGTVPPPIMYVNGVAAGTVNEAVPPDGNTVNTEGVLRLGARDTGATNYIDGDMDVMVMWERALAAEEVAQHYAATAPRFQGSSSLQLLDHAVASVATSTLTLTGVDSDRSAALLVVGKVIRSGNGVFELRPVPGNPLGSISSRMNIGQAVAAPVAFTSASGWAVAGGLGGDASVDSVTFFAAWIWPKKLNGTTPTLGQQRLFRSIAAADVSGVINSCDSFGIWTTVTDDENFESITLDGIGGLQMQPDSEVYLYRLGASAP